MPGRMRADSSRRTYASWARVRTAAIPGLSGALGIWLRLRARTPAEEVQEGLDQLFEHKAAPALRAEDDRWAGFALPTVAQDEIVLGSVPDGRDEEWVATSTIQLHGAWSVIWFARARRAQFDPVGANHPQN